MNKKIAVVFILLMAFSFVIVGCSESNEVDLPQPDEKVNGGSEMPSDGEDETVKRASEKVGTIEIEGMKEDIVLNLHYDKDFGISTYAPENMISETISSDNFNTLIIKLEANEDVAIEISKYRGFNDYKEVVEHINSTTFAGVEGLDVSKYSESDFDFAEEVFVVVSSEVSGEILVFSRNGELHSITYHYPTEFGEGWYPRFIKIIDEIVWE